MGEYPEHDRLRAVADESQAIGEFLVFGGYTLCKVREEGDNGEPRYIWTDLGQQLRREPEADQHPTAYDCDCGYAERNPAYDSWGSGFEAVGQSIQQILADYFEIDLGKIEAEKRAMLDAIRAMNA